MSREMYERMGANPKFQELVTKRGRFAWTLSIIVLTLFYGFVLMVAFMPKLLGSPIAEGSMVTVGVVAELFLFIFFWGLAALYIKRANTEFDKLTREIIIQATEEVQK